MNYFIYICTPLIFLILLFIIGFIIYKIFNTKILYNLKFPLIIPICITLGISFIIIFFTSLSLIIINYYICLYFILFFIFIFLYRHYKYIFRWFIKGRYKIYLKDLIIYILFICTFVIFMNLSLILKYSLPGDAYFHGKLTSIILYLNRLPIYKSFNIISNVTFVSNNFYPPGFHVLSSFYSILFLTNPFYSNFLVSICIVIIFPLLMFSIIYFYTKSLKLSIISYFITFYCPSKIPKLWESSYNILLGNFLSGIYPALLGNFLYVSTLFFINKKSDKKYNILIILILISLLFSYYFYVPYFILYMLLKFTNKKFFLLNTILKKILLTIIAFVALMFIIYNRQIIINFYHIDTLFLYSDFINTYDLLNKQSTYYIYTIFILISLIISINLIIFKKQYDLSLFYLSICIPFLLSLNKILYTNIFWFVRQNRVFILVVFISYLIILIGINEFKNIFNIKMDKLHNITIIKNVSFLFILFILITNMSIYINVSQWSINNMNAIHDNDLKALKWLSKNTSNDDIILNDRTLVSLWLPSFNVLNIINERDLLREIYLFNTLNNINLLNRTIESNKILEHPYNYQENIEIIKKYNITYIYLSDSTVQFLHIGRGEFIPPFTWTGEISQKERLSYYIHSPFLEIVYQSGNACIFRVKYLEYNEP